MEQNINLQENVEEQELIEVNLEDQEPQEDELNNINEADIDWTVEYDE